MINDKKIRMPLPDNAKPNSIDILVSYYSYPDKYKVELVNVPGYKLEIYGFSVNPVYPLIHFAERLTYDLTLAKEFFQFLEKEYNFNNPYAYNIVFATSDNWQYVMGKNIMVR